MASKHTETAAVTAACRSE